MSSLPKSTGHVYPLSGSHLERAFRRKVNSESFQATLEASWRSLAFLPNEAPRWGLSSRAFLKSACRVFQVKRLCALRALRANQALPRVLQKTSLRFQLYGNCPPTGVNSKCTIRLCQRAALCPFCYIRYHLRPLFGLMWAPFTDTRLSPYGVISFTRTEPSASVEGWPVERLAHNHVMFRRLHNACEEYLVRAVSSIQIPQEDGSLAARYTAFAVVPNRTAMPLERPSIRRWLAEETRDEPQKASLARFLAECIPFPPEILFLDNREYLLRFGLEKLRHITGRMLAFRTNSFTIEDADRQGDTYDEPEELQIYDDRTSLGSHDAGENCATGQPAGSAGPGCPDVEYAGELVEQA